MRFVFIATLVLTSPLELGGQSRPDLFRCEGCEAIHERTFRGLPAAATIPPAGEAGERLVLSGRVLEPDGTTPAPGVVVYAYHTNAAGVYPAHIHPIVKEPDRREYWIDEIVFLDDVRVDERYRGAQGNRGGSGIIRLTRDPSGTWIGRRDIVLER